MVKPIFVTMKKIFFLIFLFNSTTYTLFAQQKEYNYKKIDSLLNDHSITGALGVLKILEKEFVNDTISSTYWVSHARACQALHRYDKAKKSIDKSVKKDSLNAEAHYKRAVFYTKLEDFKTALQALNKVILINDSAGMYYYYRGIINHQIYQFDAAENDYKKAIENNYSTTNLYTDYARLFLEKGNYNEALHQINKAISISTYFSRAYYIRAITNFFLLDFEAACTDRRITIEIDANNSDISVIIPDRFCTSSENEQLEFAAASFTKNGKLTYKQAILAYTKLIKLDAQNDIFYNSRGAIYVELNDYKSAKKDFNKALEINPNSLESLGNRAFSYFMLGNYEEAKNDAQKSLDLNPSYIQAYALLGQAKYKLGLDNYCADLLKARELKDPDIESIILALHCN